MQFMSSQDLTIQGGMVELAYYEPVDNTISVGCWTTLSNVPNKYSIWTCVTLLKSSSHHHLPPFCSTHLSQLVVSNLIEKIMLVKLDHFTKKGQKFLKKNETTTYSILSIYLNPGAYIIFFPATNLPQAQTLLAASSSSETTNGISHRHQWCMQGMGHTPHDLARCQAERSSTLPGV